MALVLTLKDGEMIFIGPDITLVLEKKKASSGYRIVIEAPRDVKILTSKTLRKQQKELT